jgi:hypothetical protein
MRWPMKRPVPNIWLHLHSATLVWTDCASSFYLVCWRTSVVSSSNVGSVFAGITGGCIHQLSKLLAAGSKSIWNIPAHAKTNKYSLRLEFWWLFTTSHSQMYAHCERYKSPSSAVALLNWHVDNENWIIWEGCRVCGIKMPNVMHIAVIVATGKFVLLKEYRLCAVCVCKM